MISGCGGLALLFLFLCARRVANAPSLLTTPKLTFEEKIEELQRRGLVRYLQSGRGGMGAPMPQGEFYDGGAEEEGWAPAAAHGGGWVWGEGGDAQMPAASPYPTRGEALRSEAEGAQ